MGQVSFANGQDQDICNGMTEDKRKQLCDGADSDDRKKGQCQEAMKCHIGQSEQDQQNTANDMTDPGASTSGGGGAAMGLLGGLAGGALGAMLAGKQAAKKAEEAAKEAEAKLNEKLDEAAKQQEEQLAGLKDELTAAASGEGAVVGEAPTIGATGIVAEIEAAASENDTSKVQQLVLANIGQLPDSYIEDLEQRLGISIATKAGFKPDRLPSSLNDVDIAMGSVVQTPKGSVDVNDMISNGLVDQTRDLILELIQKQKVKEAHYQIVRLEDSSDIQMSSLGREMRRQLDETLQKMGLPTGAVGISLLN